MHQNSRRAWAWAGCVAASFLMAAPALLPGQDTDGRNRDDQGQAEKKTQTGELVSMSERQIVLKTSKGDETTVKLSDAAKVTLNNKNATLKDLRKGDRVTVSIGEEETAIALAATRSNASTARNGGSEELAQNQNVRDPREGDERTPARSDPNANAAQRPILGVRLGPSPTTGVRVREVMQQSNAATAGLRPGDYILSINGRKIASTDDVDQALAGLELGADADFGIWRNGENQQLKVNFAERRLAGFRGEENANNQGDREERGNREDRNDQANRRNSDDRQSHGWLGIMVVNPNQTAPGQQPPATQQKGVVVRGVYPSGPASRAGFRTGDVIVSINGEDVSNPEDVIATIQKIEPGQQAEFVVDRGGESQTLKPTIAERSQFLGQQQSGPQNFNQGVSQNPGQNRGFQGSSDFGEDIPEHAMMLEHNRRLAEQHQRIEERLDQVLQELQAIRKQLGNSTSSGKSSNRDNSKD